ncbi:hypothetical protein [Aquimarina algiphila]|uniref:hypothetical protein n=1 Tax=Aquimarina algiphila TaxID=2047982 RepID=UPI001430626E|nr:hypothetical protein [Aquimarina algiphila]
MNNKTLFKTSEFISSLQSNGVEVTVNDNPNSSTLNRIKRLIKNKEMLFNFQKSLFN